MVACWFKCWVKDCCRKWYTHVFIIFIGFVICGSTGVFSVWNTLSKSQTLQDDHLPLYQRALKLKWLHYKVLELATRSIERHELFFNLYAATRADMSTELTWMLVKVDEMGKGNWQASLLAVEQLNAERSAEDELAIDGEECTQWGTFDCTVAVPGVASNVDITVSVTDGQSACDAVDVQGGGICEWIPERPDEVPEPQPPNLLNKCVCYACKGPLPDASSGYQFPAWYEGSQRGTDGKHQCLNDPRYKGKCHWDGLNCVPDTPKPNPSLLNTTSYMQRFDSILSLLESTEAEVRTEMLDAIDLLISFSDMSVISTSSVAALYTIIVFGFSCWHLRPTRKYTLGLAFFTMTGLFLLLAWSCFIFIIFTGLHIRDQCTTLRDQELVMYEVAWDVIYYDATLTTSASRFVMTAHNSGWIDEDYTGVPEGVRVYDYWFINYIETVGNLDNSINYAVTHASSPDEQQIFSTIDTVNKMLVDLEQISLCSCEPPDASALPANDTTLGVSSLYSSTYLQAKETYNQQNRNFLNVQMQRLLVRVRELESKAELMLIMAVTIVLFTTLSLTEIFRQIMSRKLQRQAEYQQRRTRIHNILANTVDLLAHPLITIRGDIFIGLGKMVQHEDARRNGILTYSDSPHQAAELWILFISHQWLASGPPDPAGVQYKAICSAIHEVSKIHGVKPVDMHIWLDYHSIPQFNGVSVGVGVSAVASLVNYAMYSTAMCVIAPEALHKHGHTCNFSTYMSRGWCRAEQAGYMLRNGINNLYIQDETGFRVPSETMENYEAFYPMEGAFTCCRLKHPGGCMCDREKLVDVMLYLYYAAKQLHASEEHTVVYNFVMKNKARIFPATFNKTIDKSDNKESRELFGSLIRDLDVLVDSGEVALHPEGARPILWSKEV